MKPTLYISKRSPFARRIRILLQELNVDHDIEIVDVFQPPQWLFDVNPLGRVPTLKLENGECVVDSNQIFGFLKNKYSEHPLFLNGGHREATMANISGVAVGLIEITINYFLETLRPQALRIEEDLQEYRRNLLRGMRYLEDTISSQGPFFTGDTLRACDADVGAALGYFEFRVGHHLLSDFPKLQVYYAHLSKRPSLTSTKPLE